MWLSENNANGLASELSVKDTYEPGVHRVSVCLCSESCYSVS